MKKATFGSFVVAGALAFATTVTAAPIGLLSIDSGGQGVRVTATTIDWFPLAGGSGTMISAIPTNVIYSGGVLSNGVAGIILDLPPVPVNAFMTFNGHPDLAFNLAGIGPGSSNLDCSSVDQPGESCSLFAGSPFILTYVTATKTAISLGAFGNAVDADGSSLWSGAFTTQVTKSIPQIQAAIFGPNGPGYIDSSYSGEFELEFIPEVPEPASMLLLGLALGAAAIRRRRR